MLPSFAILASPPICTPSPSRAHGAIYDDQGFHWRRVSRLSARIRKRIDNIIAKSFPIVIGDANGADKAVQTYLHSKHYDDVEVFCSEGQCRNNVGDWKVRNVPAGMRERSAQFYSAKDRAMSDEADVGLMIWDGKSAGTLLNVMRLVSLEKKAVVYIVPDAEFREFRRQQEWQDFFAHCNVELRRKVEQRATQEIRSGNANLQSALPGFW